MRTKWRKRKAARRVEFAGRVITAFLDEFTVKSLTIDARSVRAFIEREFG